MHTPRRATCPRNERNDKRNDPRDSRSFIAKKSRDLTLFDTLWGIGARAWRPRRRSFDTRNGAIGSIEIAFVRRDDPPRFDRCRANPAPGEKRQVTIAMPLGGRRNRHETLVRHTHMRRTRRIPTSSSTRSRGCFVQVRLLQCHAARRNLGLASPNDARRDRTDENTHDPKRRQNAQEGPELPSTNGRQFGGFVFQRRCLFRHKKSRSLKTNTATVSKPSDQPIDVSDAMPRYAERFTEATSPSKSGRGGT
jgi:hypothetical protein